MGKPKEGPGVRLKRQIKSKNRAERLARQLKYMADEDIEMIKEAVKWLDTKYLNRTRSSNRNKRFGLATWILSWGVYRTYSSIKAIKDNIRALQEQNLLQQDQIIELSHYLNITNGHVSSNRYAITNLQARMAETNKTLVAALSDVEFVKYTVAIVNDIRIVLAKLTLGAMSLEQNVNATYEYMWVLSSRQVNPLIIPPDSRLPEDPNINIWNYYTIMKIIPVVMDDFLLIILTIPLTDQSLEMDLYKVYNIPALHPKLKIEFTYQLEREYLAIPKSRLYAAIPTAREFRICVRAQKSICAS